MAKQKSVQTARARTLRRDLTPAERRMWHMLRSAQLEGLKFRRQHPVGPFIADFACLAIKLVVEIDGGQHNESISDAGRDAYMQAHGWNILRFWNNDVLKNTQGVLISIIRVCKQRVPSPDAGKSLRHPLPPAAGEG